jgi:hypothetical protein
MDSSKSSQNLFLINGPAHPGRPVYRVCSSAFFTCPDCRHYDPDGGVPDGRVPDGGVPEGRVPFICIPSGGVPEGRVPFICIPSGGVPCGPADWLNCGLSAVPAWSDVTDDAIPPEVPTGAVPTACVCPAAGDDVLPVWPDTLPVSWVQPATRIPATRIADAISIMILLFFIGYIS